MPERRPRKRHRGGPTAPQPARAQEATEILQEIGALIRAARVAAALTQESAAARAGIDYKRWQRLEQGSLNPTTKTLLRVAEAVDTSFWDLLSPSSRKLRPSTTSHEPAEPVAAPRRRSGRSE